MEVDTVPPPPLPRAPELNFDILFTIMSFAHNPGIARMMRTCSTLYHGGAKLLLSEPVQLATDGAVISFCFFMLAEKRARFRYLRALTLDTGLLHESAARGLVVILRRMAHLTALSLANAQDLLRSARDLPDALAGLPALRTLSIANADRRACELLRALPPGATRLTALRLEFGYVGEDMEIFYETIDPDDLPDFHPVALCAAVAPTLERLSVAYCNTAGTEMWGPAAPVVYPRMRTLELQDEWPLMRPYIRAFPNLVRLTIRSNREEYGEDLSSMADWFDENRQVNMEDQLVNAQWHHLEEYDGAVIGLYLAGLPCRIPRVKLWLVEEEHLPLLDPILTDAKPTELDMRVRGLLLDLDAPKSILSSLRQDGCASLTALRLNLDICNKDRHKDVVQALVCPVAALEPWLHVR